MTWWRRAARNRLLDVGAVVIALLHAVAIARMLPSRVFDFDFNHDYVSGLMLLRGQNPYTTSHGPLCAQYGFAFQESYLRTSTYPPSILWLFAPLALLPPRAAFAVWVAAQAGGLGVILWLTRRLLGGRLSARGWRFVCCAALASTAVYWHFFGSNAELILAAVVLAGYAGRRVSGNRAPNSRARSPRDGSRRWLASRFSSRRSRAATWKDCQPSAICATPRPCSSFTTAAGRCARRLKTGIGRFPSVGGTTIEASFFAAGSGNDGPSKI